MKKKTAVVLSCLSCIGMLAYGSLSAQAAFVSPDECTHPNFALSYDGPTGEYAYLESGHYEVWGEGHTCLRCRYTFYTNVHYVFSCNHEWEQIPCEVIIEDGITTNKYACTTSECDKQYVVTTQVQ